MHPAQLTLWPVEPQADATSKAVLTVAAAWDAFINAHAVKPSTREHYRTTQRVFQSRFAPDSPLPETPEQIEKLLAGVNVADTTRDGYFRDIRCFYRWCAKRLGTPDATAQVQRARVRAPLPDVLTNADIAKLLRIKNRRDRALIAFALDTGARLHELAGVRRRDISTTTDAAGREHFTVRLRGSADAAGNWRLKTGERLVPLSRPAAALLTGIGQGDALWTTTTLNRYSRRAAPGEAQAMTQHGIQLAIRRATCAALGRAHGPHTLRHTFATMYLRAGGDLESLRRIMGHARIETTLIYLHLVADDLAEKHDSYSPIARAQR